MDPVKENVDKAMTQIHKTWWKHVDGLAEKFANHPDPKAWFKHFNHRQCLEDMEQGPPPKPSVAGSSGAEANAVKRGRVDGGENSDIPAATRRRVDDGGGTSEAYKNVSKTLKWAVGATYSFNGPAEFWVKTVPLLKTVCRTLPGVLVVPGGATVWIEHAVDVGVVEVPAPVVKKLSFPAESNRSDSGPSTE